MGTGRALRRTYVRTFHYSSYRLPCLIRNRAAALHGAHSRSYGEKTHMDLSLFCIRDLERDNNVLGM